MRFRGGIDWTNSIAQLDAAFRVPHQRESSCLEEGSTILGYNVPQLAYYPHIATTTFEHTQFIDGANPLH